MKNYQISVHLPSAKPIVTLEFFFLSKNPKVNPSIKLLKLSFYNFCALENFIYFIIKNQNLLNFCQNSLTINARRDRKQKTANQIITTILSLSNAISLRLSIIDFTVYRYFSFYYAWREMRTFVKMIEVG